MKILLLGKSGMLGSAFLKFLGDEHEVFAFSSDLDICDRKKLREVFADFGPELVLNCAAYTNVDKAEEERDLVFKVNAEGVQNLADLCGEFGAMLVHFSTDYVFDGEKQGGYLEEDETGPINVYGESKLTGEKAALSCGRAYVVRTSWLFGPDGGNFVDTMLRLGKERDELSVVGDQIGSPTYTVDLCEAVMEKLIGAEFGIYHITNSGVTSWHDFAREIFEVGGVEIDLKEIGSEDYKTAARRPKNSVLSSGKLDFGMRSWQEALKTYLG